MGNPTAESMRSLRRRLYAHYGRSAITKAADELGIDRSRISHVLSKGAVQLTRDLEDLLEKVEG
jgi:hypothetical protein